MTKEEKQLQKAKKEIQKILEKYNCNIISQDSFTNVLIEHKKTFKTDSLNG